MGDQILTDLDTVLKKLDEKNNSNKTMNVSEYNNEFQVVMVNLCTNEKTNVALQTLKSLIDMNIHSIQKDVIKILEDADIEKRLKNTIVDSLTKYLINLIYTKNITDLICFYETWKSYDIEKFKEMLANLNNRKTQPECSYVNPVDFLIEVLLFEILNCEDNKLRQSLAELTILYIQIFPISDLEPDEYEDFLLKLPSLITNMEGLQETKIDIWRDAFHILLKYIDQKSSNLEIQEIFNNASINWNELVTNITNECLKYISDGNITDLTKVYTDCKNWDYQKFSDSLKELCCGTESLIKCRDFLFDKLIPLMMCTTNVNDTLKIPQIELGLEFASVFPICSLSESEYQTFLKNVNDYIKNISDLRDNQFECWEKLWMFLVRLLGKKLHHSMSLINRLLRVVEHAFRNSAYEQRLKGYDCWKELIDNVSLDAHHLSSEKQIRLLLTPLRAKFSRQEIVIFKRFDVFIYLIEKLQGNAVLVLKEFLEFCFGEVSDDTDPHKAGQGKSFSGLWLRSAKVLIAIFGHSHNKDENCLDTSTEVDLKAPVLNPNNISTYCTTVINSVIECCILLKNVELNQQRETVLKCLCNSLITLIIHPDVEKKEKCMDVLCKSFDTLLKDNDPYQNSIAVTLFKCSISLDSENALFMATNNLIHFLKIIFTIPLGSDNYVQIDTLRALLTTAGVKEQKEKYENTILDAFIKYKTVEANVHLVASFWTHLITELDQFPKTKLTDLLLWPALYAHQIKDQAKQALVYDKFEVIVTKFVEKTTELHIGLLKNLEKCLRNNPLLLKNILSLVILFPTKLNNKEITNTTLELLLHILITPFIGDNSFKLEAVESYLKQFYESNLAKLQEQDTIKKLCMCVEHLLKSKRYGILVAITKCMQNLPDNVQIIHAKYLSLDLLMDLFEKESDLRNTEKLHKLIDILRNIKPSDVKKDIKMFMPVGGRSAKIADLVKQIPASPVKDCKSPSTLRLFGKDIETMSPLNVKGTHLKEVSENAPMKPPSSNIIEKKSRKSFSIDDESNSKFVLIDSEVKLKHDKLTEHQKESLKKRREDIPALYQDLSQSISHSLDINLTNSKSEEESVNLETKKDSDEINDNLNSEENITITSREINCLTEIENGHKPSVVESDEQLKDDDKDSCDSIDNCKTDKVKHATKKGMELKKLVMNIVGADEFLATPPRRSWKDKKLDDKQENQLSNIASEVNHNKIDTVPIEELDKNSPDSTGKPEEKPIDESVENNTKSSSPKRGRRKSMIKRKKVNNEEGENILSSPKDDNDISLGKKHHIPEESSSTDKNKDELDHDKSIETDLELQEELSKHVSVKGDSSLKVILRINPNGEFKRKPGRPAGSGKSRIKQPRRPISHAVRKSLRKTTPSKKLAQLEEKNGRYATDESTFANENELSENDSVGDFKIYKAIDVKSTPLESKSKNLEQKRKPGRPRSSPKDKSSAVKNITKKGRKRKRSDDESEDCIESSQDSSVSSANATTLRKSLNIKINVSNMTSDYAQPKDHSLIERKNKRKYERLTTEKSNISEQHISQSEDLFTELGKSLVINHISTEKHKKRKSKSPKDGSSRGKNTEQSIKRASLVSPAKTESKRRGSDSENIEIIRRHIMEAIEQVATDESEIPNKRKNFEINSTSTIFTSNKSTISEQSSPDENKDSIISNKRKKKYKLRPISTALPSNCSMPVKSPTSTLIESEQSLQDAAERIQNQDTQTQETQTQETESIDCDPNNIQVHLDVLQKPTLTDSDRVIARMETASLPLDSSDFKDHSASDIEVNKSGFVDDKTLTNSSMQMSPKNAKAETSVVTETESIVSSTEDAISEVKEEEILESPDQTLELNECSIPSSPVTGDTPNRNSELLNSTLDISPIALKHSSKDSLSDDDDDDEDDEFVEESPKLVPVALKFDNEDVGYEDNKEKSPEKADDAPEKADSAPEKYNKLDVEKQTCEKGEETTIVKSTIADRSSKFLSVINGPIKRRIIVKTMSPSASRIKKLMSNVKAPSCEDVVTSVNQEDILTFSREVPSPLAVPRSSILKRKYSETTEDGLSPCPKRKRVNFSDPCTTSKKIFIKDDNCDKELFPSSTEEDIDKQLLEILSANSADSLETDSENLETEESLQINNPLMLRNDRPIYPDLVNCEGDISLVARKLTGPMFIKALLMKLKNKGIKTIGDLAKTTESDVSKFPFKAPVIPNVFKVLDKYYNKNYKSTKEKDQSDSNENENGNYIKEAGQAEAENSLALIIEKVRAEGTSTPAICDILFPLLDRNDVITYTKSHFDLVTKDGLESATSNPNPCSSSDTEIPETELSCPNKSITDALYEHLASDNLGQDEIVKMYTLIVNKLESLSPTKLMDLAIKTLQKIPLKE